MPDTPRKTGRLFVVATPIGNLQDVSLRALEVLASVDWIAAEDTRHSRLLLQRHGVRTPTRSYHEHNERFRQDSILDALLNGADVALISDAGTPLINDPGYRLVRAVQDAGVVVVPVPGPCALVAALSVSGLPTDRFVFEGFLPARAVARRQRLAELVHEPRTMVFYESPHRVVSCLTDMAASFGCDREAFVARELTKRFETTHRAALGDLCRWVRLDSDQQRGELVILIAGDTGEHADAAEAQRILELLLPHLPVTRVARIAAEITGMARNDLYQQALEIKNRS